jgi:hypothetical protein
MKYIKKFESIDWNYIDEEKPDIMPEFKDNEDFYNFLVENDVLDKFIDHYNKYKFKKISLKKYLKNKKKLNLIYNLIDYSFNWTITPEGHKFWSKLNDKWRNKLRK